MGGGNHRLNGISALAAHERADFANERAPCSVGAEYKTRYSDDDDKHRRQGEHRLVGDCRSATETAVLHVAVRRVFRQPHKLESMAVERLPSAPMLAVPAAVKGPVPIFRPVSTGHRHPLSALPILPRSARTPLLIASASEGARLSDDAEIAGWSDASVPQSLCCFHSNVRSALVRGAVGLLAAFIREAAVIA